MASQFLGLASTTVEVNPFLVDVIRSKLEPFNADSLAHVLGGIRGRAERSSPEPSRFFRYLPPTFIQPGHAGRWLFSTDVAARIAALLQSINQVREPAQRRFFKVLLGGLLVETSNATVNGKGRRYRRNWEKRQVRPEEVDEIFSLRCEAAISDVHRFSDRPRVRANVISGDARRFRTQRVHDLAVFSPPYPNSFDYTDVYNIELWMLQYLTAPRENRELRLATLSSHVQLNRRFAAAPAGSATLNETLAALNSARERLWSPWIPDMIGAYFSDLTKVMTRVRGALRDGATSWMVVGDSRYAGVFVPTAEVLKELAPQIGWSVIAADPFRSMRSSSQHGGVDELSESLIILQRKS